MNGRTQTTTEPMRPKGLMEAVFIGVVALFLALAITRSASSLNTPENPLICKHTCCLKQR